MLKEQAPIGIRPETRVDVIDMRLLHLDNLHQDTRLARLDRLSSLAKKRLIMDLQDLGDSDLVSVSDNKADVVRHNLLFLPEKQLLKFSDRLLRREKKAWEKDRRRETTAREEIRAYMKAREKEAWQSYGESTRQEVEAQSITQDELVDVVEGYFDQVFDEQEAKAEAQESDFAQAYQLLKSVRAEIQKLSEAVDLYIEKGQAAANTQELQQQIKRRLQALQSKKAIVHQGQRFGWSLAFDPDLVGQVNYEVFRFNKDPSLKEARYLAGLVSRMCEQTSQPSYYLRTLSKFPEAEQTIDLDDGYDSTLSYLDDNLADIASVATIFRKKDVIDQGIESTKAGEYAFADVVSIAAKRGDVSYVRAWDMLKNPEKYRLAYFNELLGVIQRLAPEVQWSIDLKSDKVPKKLLLYAGVVAACGSFIGTPVPTDIASEGCLEQTTLGVAIVKSVADGVGHFLESQAEKSLARQTSSDSQSKKTKSLSPDLSADLEEEPIVPDEQAPSFEELMQDYSDYLERQEKEELEKQAQKESPAEESEKGQPEEVSEQSESAKGSSASSDEGRYDATRDIEPLEKNDLKWDINSADRKSDSASPGGISPEGALRQAKIIDWQIIASENEDTSGLFYTSFFPYYNQKKNEFSEHGSSGPWSEFSDLPTDINTSDIALMTKTHIGRTGTRRFTSVPVKVGYEINSGFLGVYRDGKLVEAKPLKVATNLPDGRRILDGSVEELPDLQENDEIRLVVGLSKDPTLDFSQEHFDRMREAQVEALDMSVLPQDLQDLIHELNGKSSLSDEKKLTELQNWFKSNTIYSFDNGIYQYYDRADTTEEYYRRLFGTGNTKDDPEYNADLQRRVICNIVNQAFVGSARNLKLSDGMIVYAEGYLNDPRLIDNENLLTAIELHGFASYIKKDGQLKAFDATPSKMDKSASSTFALMQGVFDELQSEIRKADSGEVSDSSLSGLVDKITSFDIPVSDNAAARERNSQPTTEYSWIEAEKRIAWDSEWRTGPEEIMRRLEKESGESIWYLTPPEKGEYTRQYYDFLLGPIASWVSYSDESGWVLRPVSERDNLTKQGPKGTFQENSTYEAYKYRFEKEHPGEEFTAKPEDYGYEIVGTMAIHSNQFYIPSLGQISPRSLGVFTLDEQGQEVALPVSQVVSHESGISVVLEGSKEKYQGLRIILKYSTQMDQGLGQREGRYNMFGKETLDTLSNPIVERDAFTPGMQSVLTFVDEAESLEDFSNKLTQQAGELRQEFPNIDDYINGDLAAMQKREGGMYYTDRVKLRLLHDFIENNFQLTWNNSWFDFYSSANSAKDYIRRVSLVKKVNQETATVFFVAAARTMESDKFPDRPIPVGIRTVWAKDDFRQMFPSVSMQELGLEGDQKVPIIAESDGKDMSYFGKTIVPAYVLPIEGLFEEAYEALNQDQPVPEDTKGAFYSVLPYDAEIIDQPIWRGGTVDYPGPFFHFKADPLTEYQSAVLADMLRQQYPQFAQLPEEAFAGYRQMQELSPLDLFQLSLMEEVRLKALDLWMNHKAGAIFSGMAGLMSGVLVAEYVRRKTGWWRNVDPKKARAIVDEACERFNIPQEHKDKYYDFIENVAEVSYPRAPILRGMTKALRVRSFGKRQKVKKGDFAASLREDISYKQESVLNEMARKMLLEGLLLPEEEKIIIRDMGIYYDNHARRRLMNILQRKFKENFARNVAGELQPSRILASSWPYASVEDWDQFRVLARKRIYNRLISAVKKQAKSRVKRRHRRKYNMDLEPVIKWMQGNESIARYIDDLLDDVLIPSAKYAIRQKEAREERLKEMKEERKEKKSKTDKPQSQ